MDSALQRAIYISDIEKCADLKDSELLSAPHQPIVKLTGEQYRALMKLAYADLPSTRIRDSAG